MAATPILERFVAEVANNVRAKNGLQLKNILVIEPPYGQLYAEMINELQGQFPKGREDALEAKCSHMLAALNDEEDTQWTAFTKFIVQYFGFLRDVNIQNLLETYNLLSELVQYVDVFAPAVLHSDILH